MGRCPKCGKDLQGLLFSVTEHASYWFDGENYVLDECVADDGYYLCPYCNKTITANYDEAKAILKAGEGLEMTPARA